MNIIIRIERFDVELIIILPPKENDRLKMRLHKVDNLQELFVFRVRLQIDCEVTIEARLAGFTLSGIDLGRLEFNVVSPSLIRSIRIEMMDPEQLHHQALRVVIQILLRQPGNSKTGSLKDCAIFNVCIHRETLQHHKISLMYSLHEGTYNLRTMLPRRHIPVKHLQNHIVHRLPTFLSCFQHTMDLS